jgi:hypothetical protein
VLAGEVGDVQAGYLNTRSDPNGTKLSCFSLQILGVIKIQRRLEYEGFEETPFMKI